MSRTHMLLVALMLIVSLALLICINVYATDLRMVGLGIMKPRHVNIDGWIEFGTSQHAKGEMVLVYDDDSERRLIVPKGALVKLEIKIPNYDDILEEYDYSAIWLNPNDPYPTIVNFPVAHLLINGKDYCVEGCIIKSADIEIQSDSVKMDVHVHVLKDPEGLTTLIVDGKKILYRQMNGDDIRVEIFSNNPYEFGIELNASADGATAANLWVQGMGHAYINGREVPALAALGTMLVAVVSVLLWVLSNAKLCKGKKK